MAMHWQVRYRENSRTWFGRFGGTGLSLTEVALTAMNRAEAELECEALAKRAAAGARVVRQADDFQSNPERTEGEATYASNRWQSVDENGKTADDNMREEIAAIRKAVTTGEHSQVKDKAQSALNMLEHRLLGERKNGPTEVPIWYLKSHEERLPGFARSWSPRGDVRVSVRLEGKSECFLAQPHQVIPRELPASQLFDLMLKAVAIENGDLPRPRPQPQPLASERGLDYPLREGAKVGPLELSSFTFKGEEFWHVKIQAPDYARFAEYDDQFAVVVEGPRDQIDALTRAWIQSIAALLPSEGE